MENDILFDEWSPVGNISAFVEKSDRNYYFYLWINPESDEPEIRSCWICNRTRAPKNIDEAFQYEGEAPSMPEEYVAHDINGMEIDEESLSVQWFEEGDAAALLSGDKIIAVIPCFAGYKDFHGYSAYAKGTGPFAWELKGAYAKFERQVKESAKFWDFFEDEDFWGNVQDFHLDTIERFFGKHEKYYAIDGGEFPPKALVTGRKDNVVYAVTLGVSMIPMPKVEMNYEDDYKDYRRMEIAFACDEAREDVLQKLYSTISYLTAYPWEYQTFFGHGHTIPCEKIEGYDYFLFLNSRLLPEISAPEYADFMGEKINLLWIKPITVEEQKEIAQNGVAEYLKGKDISRIHIFR